MIGIDIVKVSRIEKLIQRFGEKGLSRFLSEREIEQSRNRPHRIAGYWAVKEATSKALGVGIGKYFSFKDIEISYDKYGRPVASLSDEVVERFGIEEIAISISHDGDYSIGVVTIIAKYGNISQNQL